MEEKRVEYGIGWRHCALSVALAVVICITPISASKAETNSIPAGSPPPTTVDSGSQAAAETYYKQVSSDLHFLSPETISASKLDDVLQYLGYRGLQGVDLQKLSSDLLMGADFPALKAVVAAPDIFATNFTSEQTLRDEVIVARWFAPKITDDSHGPPHKYGWRKLVRLLPIKNQDSIEAQKRISKAFILFNFFQADLAQSPFDPTNVAVNIQVALIPTQDAINRGAAPLYWLDYDPGLKINDFLDATFDARDSSRPVKHYYVPNACFACHGNLNKPLLNFLDTDHWLDRVQPDEDFELLGNSTQPVLFDAGKDGNSDQFKIAYDRIRKLNLEIAGQNRETSPASFQSVAAQNWLNLHSGSSAHVVPIDRAIPAPPAKQAWVKGNPVDEQILPLLNRYCYRCHGSVDFNVFDKGMVADLERASKMKARLTAPYFTGDPKQDPRVAMPPDRQIPEAEKKAILDFLNTVLQ